VRIPIKVVVAALLGAFLFMSPAVAANWFQSQNWSNNQSDDDGAFIKKRRQGGASVVARIDISSQTLTLEVNGWPEGHWAISSARPGYHTPRGSYGVTRTAKVYYSKKYDNAPMPNSVFFYGGYAIHGTYHVANLGRPASHGCVRLAPANAAAFYNLVQKYGASRTRVIVTD
jgi:lipoprotein-anchoring transpeptidase ErfK/SrfK